MHRTQCIATQCIVRNAMTYTHTVPNVIVHGAWSSTRILHIRQCSWCPESTNHAPRLLSDWHLCRTKKKEFLDVLIPGTWYQYCTAGPSTISNSNAIILVLSSTCAFLNAEWTKLESKSSAPLWPPLNNQPFLAAQSPCSWWICASGCEEASGKHCWQW